MHMALKLHRKSQRGQSVIIALGWLILALGFSAIAVDTGFYLVSQNTLQSAADAGSLAATRELYASTAINAATRQTNARNMAVTFAAKHSLDQKSISVDAQNDVQFGYVNPTTKTYNANSFLTPSTDPVYTTTGGYNAVRVVAQKTSGSANGSLPTIMGRLLGINTMQAQAVSISMLDDTVNEVTSGLRPIYGCLNQYNLAAQNATQNGGSISDTTVRLFGATFTANGTTVAGCPVAPSGNWGFADFRNNAPNSPGNSELSDWFLNGYSDSVVAGNSYKSSQSGAAIASNGVTNALDQLIANQTVILVPLIDTFTGSGSNTQVHVTGFAGFVITSYLATGNQENRYIQGHFVNVVCAQGQGICQTGSATTGGGTVNLRLVL